MRYLELAKKKELVSDSELYFLTQKLMEKIDTFEGI